MDLVVICHGTSDDLKECCINLVAFHDKQMIPRTYSNTVHEDQS
jgi:hypothetical protein